MLGMNIGVAAVIAVLAAGLMARVSIMSGVESIGAALIWITPNYDAYWERLDMDYLKPDDLTTMQNLVDGVIFSPVLRRTLPSSHRGFQDSSRVFGVYPEYERIWKYGVRYGRFINDRDLRERGKTAVLGVDVARAYFSKP